MITNCSTICKEIKREEKPDNSRSVYKTQIILPSSKVVFPSFYLTSWHYRLINWDSSDVHPLSLVRRFAKVTTLILRVSRHRSDKYNGYRTHIGPVLSGFNGFRFNCNSTINSLIVGKRRNIEYEYKKKWRVRVYYHFAIVRINPTSLA